ncbi:putative Ig domain-containing protein [Methylobacter luteus]|uniref:putative Ig domain-containing protein n=1 Tax=Methylobacter luteus TaxID=415 RepID=UPI0003FA7350|nr:putative Ig domain-containing protein [Methylobacter luteus]
MNVSIIPYKMRAALLLTATPLISALPAAAALPTVPVLSNVSGEIEKLTLNDPADLWSGGTIVVGGQVVIIPRNLLLDLPANRMTLKQLFDQAPEACVSAGESGLAKSDTCNVSKTGGFATIAANRSVPGNAITGDVFIEKGREVVTGVVTFINYTDGYFRLNGDPNKPDTGVMVRLNDPDGRHTVQQGAGCIAGSPNCSPDPRFTLDADNYTNVFSTGYPLCIPSATTRQFPGLPQLADIQGGQAAGPTQAGADGSGDLLCPTTNRTVNNGEPVDDSRRFAPVMIGDNITAEGNFETINGVHFLSAHSSMIAKALTTKAGQPDYLFLDEVEMDVGGFQNERARTLIIGYATLAPTDVLIWSIHYDPINNEPHEFPLASVAGCNAADGDPTACGSQGIGGGGANIFKIRHDVDFLVGADPKLNPCAHLQADPRFAPLNVCPNGGGTDSTAAAAIADQFGILSPMPREIQARTGNSLANPGLVTLDVKGEAATNGQYLFPFGVGLGGVAFPEFNEINLNGLASPNFFTALPWTLDRRLSPGGCDPTCEPEVQPLTPYPFEGLDPRTQAQLPTGQYNDPNYVDTSLPNVRDRIFSFVSPNADRPNGNGGGTNATGNFTSTVLAFPPAEPPAIAIGVTPPVVLACTGPGTGTNTAPVIVDIPEQTATAGQSFSLLVDASDAEGDALTFSLSAAPAGMTINSSSGLIAWTPTAEQVGTHSVTAEATDGQDSDAVTFTVSVDGAGGGGTNTAPTITAIADRTVTAGQSFSLQVQASDAEGDALTFSLSAAPNGMTIDGTSGQIAWAPTVDQVGSHSVTVQVTDGQLSTAESFNVTVAPVQETLTVRRAEFRTRRGELRIDGTSSLLSNHSIDVFIGNTTAGSPIGSMSVNPLTGIFTLRTTTDLGGATQITLQSSLGEVELVNLTVRN